MVVGVVVAAVVVIVAGVVVVLVVMVVMDPRVHQETILGLVQPLLAAQLPLQRLVRCSIARFR